MKKVTKKFGNVKKNAYLCINKFKKSMNKPLNIELMEELIDCFKTIETLKEENKRLSYNVKMMESKLRDWRENNPIPKETFEEKTNTAKDVSKNASIYTGDTGFSAGQNPDKDPIGVRLNTTSTEDERAFLEAVMKALVN